MKKILNIISNIGCLFLSIVLFFLLCFYFGFDFLPKIITKDNVKVIINEVKTEELMTNTEGSLLNELYNIAKDNEMDIGIINGVVNTKEFKEIISNYYGQMVEAILYDTSAPKLETNYLISAIDQNIESVAKEYGYEINDEQKQIIMRQVNISIKKTAESIPSYEQVITDIEQEDIDTIRFLFSDNVKMVLIVIIAIVILVMALISWSIYRFAIWSGATTLIVGLIFMLLGSFVYDSLITTYPDVLSVNIKNLIENNILKTMSNTGTIALIIGIGQIVYYYVMRQNNNSTEY